MTYAQNLWLFFVLLTGIIIVPGMDMFFVIANALTGGRLRGLAATAGIMLGGICHTVFGAVGVSAIVRSSPWLLQLILIAGAGYMSWIGFTLLRSSITVGDIGTTSVRSMWAAFRQGAITCLLNPKAYLFVIAVYPQFIRSEYGSLPAQATVMGLLTLVVQFAVYGSLGLAAAGSRDFLTSNPHVTIWTGRAAGLVFIAAACLTLANGLGLV